MEGLWLIVLLGAFMAALLATRSYRRRLLATWEEQTLGPCTVWSDSDGVARIVGFDTGILQSESGRQIAAHMAPVHMFSLGAVAGAALVVRIGQLAIRVPQSQLPLWDLVWVAVPAVIWLGVCIAEHLRLRLNLLPELVQREEFSGRDALEIAGVIHLVTSRHRLWLLTLGALGLPTSVIATLVIVVLVVSLWWLVHRSGTKLEPWMVMPSELERPFLGMKDQIREGSWVAPIGLLLVIGAAALLYFNDLSSFAVAVFSAVGCGLVVASERASRMYTQQATLPQLLDHLAGLMRRAARADSLAGATA